MAISYTKTNWKAGREGGTAWTPDKLNNIENGIENAVNELNGLQTSVDFTATISSNGATPVIASGNGTYRRTGNVHALSINIPLVNVTVNAIAQINVSGIDLNSAGCPTYGTATIRVMGASFGVTAVQRGSASMFFLRGGLNGSSGNPSFTTDANGYLRLEMTW